MNSLDLRRDEAALYKLRSLYEQRGFRRTPVAKFEDYGLYVDNKSFLASEHIITFMDMDGRLLALKPDVTLSIVKNIPKKPLATAEKLFYIDEVYRLSREHREYKVLSQIGVEHIGRCDPFAGLEMVDLAIRSLSLIDSDYVLDLSHLGFVSGLFDSLGLSQSLRSGILAAIHAKRIHDVEELLCSAETPEEDARLILALADLHGPFHKALARMAPLVRNDAMREALDDLVLLEKTLRENGLDKGVFLDFSVVGDLDYYNGLVFLGYVPGVPRAVLTGGRYDNLMKRMGKKSSAIGFAVNLSELSGFRRGADVRDFDLLITYDDGTSYSSLLAYVAKLAERGKKIRLERQGFDTEAAGYTFEKHLHFSADFADEGASPC